MLIFLNTNIYLLKFPFDFDLSHYISTQFSVFLLKIITYLSFILIST